MASKLYDYLGRSVDTGALVKKGTAAPELGGVRSVWQPSAVAGLTPESLGKILAGVDNNDPHSYLTLAMEMEQREPHYSSVLGTRILAVKSLELIVEAVDDSAEAEKHADLVRDVLAGDPLQDLLSSMMDAVSKGFSVTEMDWNREGKQWYPECFHWVDPRFFQLDRVDGRTVRLKTVDNVYPGMDLQPFKFVQHTPKLKMGLPIRTGLARLCAVAFMCKGYSLKDWLAFAEVFGLPIRVGKYQEGATNDEKASLLTAVASIGTDAACIISEKMLIEFIEADRGGGGGGADRLFMGLADWLDAQVSKAVLGQTMTTDNGSSMSQAKVHNEVRHDILEHDATVVCSSIVRDVIKPLIDLNFGVQERNRYPRIRLDFEEAEDLEKLSKALPPFIDRGLKVEASVIRDKFGLPEPEEGAELLAPQSKAAPAPPGDGAPLKPGAPPADPEAQPTPDNLPPDQEAAQARVAYTKALARKLTSGAALTADERAFLVGTAVERVQPARAAQQVPVDELDRLTAEALLDWEALTEPLIAPIEMLAKGSTDYKDFASKLEQLAGELGLVDLTRSLATAAFKARGLGDAKDDPS